MPLFTVHGNILSPLPNSAFADEGWWERRDLQRLLRDRVDAIEEGLYVVAEEFGNWTDGSRRIDLLCVDRNGHLVVVELKRDDDGFMDLQAIRYAAMVANMKFEQVVAAHAAYLAKRGILEDARQLLLAHLSRSDEVEPQIDSKKPRMILVSGYFSRELTTSVLWLSDAGIDVHCVRVQLYRVGNELVLDASQILPLPEAEDYMVRVREKAEELDKPSLPVVEWTQEDVARLKAVLANPTLIELFRLCAASPGEFIPLSDTMAGHGQTHAQAKGALGGFTTLVRGRFSRSNWPIEAVWAYGGQQQMYYCMQPIVARWWNSALGSDVPNSALKAVEAIPTE